MTRLIKTAATLLAMAGIAACGPIEVRISKADGVKPIDKSFSTRVNTGDFKCGDTIVGEDNSQTYTVTSAPVQGGCRFTFDQDVEVLREADYKDIKAFTGVAKYVNRVELEIQRFEITDDTGDRFDVENRLRDLEVTVNGQLVLDRDRLGNIPQTVVLEGPGLDAIKDAVKNRRTCTARVTATLTILETSTPSSVSVHMTIQPTLVLSTAEF